MSNLYRNYTVVVQDSTAPYAPNNDLQLFLYEQQVEVKVNPGTAAKDIYNYGTSILATAVCVKGGAVAKALVADAVNRPGEYDFVDVDLNKAGSLSYLGQVTYSVVARPSGDSDFQNARVIIDRTDISDPLVKQIVRDATGSMGNIVDNLYFSGGTTLFELYAGKPSNSSEVYLSILNLPAAVSALIEVVASAPSWATTTRMISRFDVHYGDATGVNIACWSGVPAYKTADSKWVIALTNDQYCTYRSKEFGTDIDLRATYASFVITINLVDQTSYIKRFDSNATVISTPKIVTASDSREKMILSTFINAANEYIVGIGNWSYINAGNTPAYNLDVKGGLGARVTVSTYTALNINATHSKFGRDVDATSAFNTYIDFTGTTATTVVQAKQVIYADGTKIQIGYDTTAYPRIEATATNVYLRLTQYGYINVDAGSSVISVWADTGTAGVEALSITGLLSQYGYDLLGVAPSFVQFNAASSQLYVGGTQKWSINSSAFILGQNAGAYPRQVMTSSYSRMYGSAFTYLDVNSSDSVNIYANRSSVAANVLTANSSGIQVGYLAGSVCYLSCVSSKVSIYSETNQELFYAKDSEIKTIIGSSYYKLTSSAFIASMSYGGDTNSLTFNVGAPVDFKSNCGIQLTGQIGGSAAAYAGRVLLTHLSSPLVNAFASYEYNNNVPVWKIPYITGDTNIATARATAPPLGSMFIGVNGAGNSFLSVYSGVGSTGWSYSYLLPV